MNNNEDLLDLLHLKLAGIIEKEDDAYLERLLQEDEDARRLWQELQQNAVPQEYLSHIQPLVWKEICRTITRPRRRRLLRNTALVLVTTAVVAVMGGLWMQYRPVGRAVPPAALALSMAAGVTGWDTLSVPRNGKPYTMILPDNSVVRLNPGTQLKFPVSFTGKQREVYLLEGEGYFEVTPSTAHRAAPPFMVHTAQATITVLGTSFKVKSGGGSFSATLIRGKIKVTAGGKPVILIPGQKVVLDTATGKLVVKKPGTPKPSGQLIPPIQLAGCNLKDIGRWLERVYRIKVVVADQSKDRCPHESVIIDDQQPLQEFLENMQCLDDSFAYKWKNDTLYLH